MIEPEWIGAIQQFWRILIYKPQASLAWAISVAISLLLLGFSICFLAPLLAIAKRLTRSKPE